jgi:hypothetical protein
VTTSEAIAFAMACVTAAKQKAIENKETWAGQFAEALKELEKDSGIQILSKDDSDAILGEDERPDLKFDEALDVLGNAHTEFEEFENEHGEEEIWQVNSADLAWD